MEITTVIGCRVSCSYCPQNKIVNAYRKSSNITVMSFDTFKNCIDKIPSSENIYFCGMSEPWLNPECTKMIIYAHQRGHRIGVFTTLVGMKIEDIDLIDQIPFYSFCIHLPTDEGLERIKIDDAYLEIIKRILECNIRASFRYHGHNMHEKLELLFKNVDANIQKLSVHTRANNIAIEDLPSPIKKRGEIRCERNLRSNILLPNGDVILCCMDYGMEHVLGNLLKDEYKSIYCNKEFKKVEQGLSDDSIDILCRHCVYSHYATVTAKVKTYFSSLASIRTKKELQDMKEKIFSILKRRG